MNRQIPDILIDMHYLHLEGAEMSLIGLLQSLDPKTINTFYYRQESHS